MKSEDEKYPKVYLYRRIVQAKLFIDKNFHQPLNLKTIAGEAYFSDFHFLRLFKQTYRKTPHQYLIFVRLEKAKTLLSSTDLPVANVCFDVGFDSIGSFTTLFKKQIGQRPSVYRNEMAAKKLIAQTQPLRLIPHCFAEKNGWTAQKSNFQEVLDEIVM